MVSGNRMEIDRTTVLKRSSWFFETDCRVEVWMPLKQALRLLALQARREREDQDEEGGV